MVSYTRINGHYGIAIPLLLQALHFVACAQRIPSMRNDGGDNGRIFTVWTGSSSTVLQLPFVKGGQAVVEWSELQPSTGTFNFSALDDAVKVAMASLPSGRKPLFSIQINGNTHPRFLFDHVPYIPSDNSW